MDSKPRVIGISMGDPAGIGAEIAVKAIEKGNLPEGVALVVVGDSTAIVDAMNFTDSNLVLNIMKDISEARSESGILNLLDMRMIKKGEWKYGEVSAIAGKASVAYIEKAITLAMEKKISAVVTGPVNKQSINLAGCPHTGHTEIFAAMTGSKDYAMMLADKNLRVVHVSTHVPLIEACRRAKKQRVLTVIKLTHDALLRLGIASHKIAVAGLNPHAGEGGLFGDEEIKEIRPAIEEALGLGISVEGPIPPDTVFSKAMGGQYDAVVVMYHDQGHIPLKLAGFHLDGAAGMWTSVSGVNITLGLPIVRTSVDHGTAYGKAGKGIANCESMIDAIDMAVKFSSNWNQA